MWTRANWMAFVVVVVLWSWVGFTVTAEEGSGAGGVSSGAEQPEYEAAFAAEDYPGTIAAATRAIESDPECAEAYSKRGRSHARMGKLREAIPDCRRAVELDPENAEYRVYLGGLSYETGDPDKAFEHFSAAIRLGSQDGLVFANRGGLYVVKGQVAQALSDLNEAIRLDPAVRRCLRRTEAQCTLPRRSMILPSMTPMRRFG